MSKNVRIFVDSCIVCKASKGASGAQQIELHPIPKPNKPWHTIHIDITGKLTGKSDRKEYASVIIDSFTKYVLLEHTTSLDACSAVNAIKKAVNLFGSPKRIIADQGRSYASQEFKQFCSDNGIELHFIATGSSRANGQVERVMSTLKSLLTIVENDPHKVWRDELGSVQLALNSTRSRVTGYSPTELMFGITALSLGETKISPHSDNETRSNLDAIRNIASQNIQKAADSESLRFNKRKAKVNPYNVGDFVFIKCNERNQSKLDRKFRGPFIIIRVLENDRYELKNIVGSSRLYKYSHENLRVVPRGYAGLTEISDILTNYEDDEPVTAMFENNKVGMHQHDDSANLSDTSDTMSVGSNTLSADSDTLTTSSNSP